MIQDQRNSLKQDHLKQDPSSRSRLMPGIGLGPLPGWNALLDFALIAAKEKPEGGLGTPPSSSSS
jgi:hypothetical protein